MKVRPLCTHCGERHWMFVKCEQAPEWNRLEDAKIERARVIPRWNDPRPQWGADKPGMYTRLGENTFVLRRKGE